jgi:hypothetical protein
VPSSSSKNRVLDRFGDERHRRIEIHTCPGGDLDSAYSLDVHYAVLLPDLFTVYAGNAISQGSAAKWAQTGAVGSYSSGAPLPPVLAVLADYSMPRRRGICRSCMHYEPRVPSIGLLSERQLADQSARPWLVCLVEAEEAGVN